MPGPPLDGGAGEAGRGPWRRQVTRQSAMPPDRREPEAPDGLPASRTVNRLPRHPARFPAPLLGDDDIARLQTLLDALPPPCEPLDAAMLDGYLCGVLLQPRRVPDGDWLPVALDASDGARSPAAPAALIDLLRRRHAELDAAIERRDWFDPWVFDLETAAPAGDAPAGVREDAGAVPDAAADDEDSEDEDAASPTDAVQPWVAGFALAMERFPGLMALDAADALEPLALLFRHLPPDELEDADELIALIETLEAPAGLGDAVEELVRATLLLADVARPRRPAAGGARRPAVAPGAKRGSRR